MPGIRHLQLRVEGLIGASQTWSINPKFSYPTTAIPTQSVMDAWATAVAALNSGFILPNPTLYGDAVSVTGCTASYINDAGQSVVIAKSTFASPNKALGTAKMPPQTSLVTTLQTNVPGRQARGRLYWPYLALTIDSTTLRVSSATQLQIASSTAAWLQDLEDAYPGSESVQSAVISMTGGTATPITSVRVGDVLDTQRRRRDQLLEAYATAPLT